MKSVGSLFILASQAEGFGVNSNILETNLINILLLIILLVYALGNFLKESLLFRQEQIINSIEEGEKRINEAQLQLSEIQAQSDQTRIIVQEIEDQTKRTKAGLTKYVFEPLTQDLYARFEIKKMIILDRKELLKSEIKKRIYKSALHQATAKLQSQLETKQQSAIIDSRIHSLGGPL